MRVTSDVLQSSGRTFSALPGLRLSGKPIDNEESEVCIDDQVLDEHGAANEDLSVERLYEDGEDSRQAERGSGEAPRGCLAQLLNTSHLLSDAADALVDDSFFRCFASAPPDPWNWNWYLFPTWCLGVFMRYFIIFPMRVVVLLLANSLFFALFFPLQLAMKDSHRRRQMERALVQFAACGWVASWCGVIKYHGPRPVPAPNRIWVANHSSMIDYTILAAYMPFAAIMQLHPGWVGFLQKRVLSCLGCLWFNRTEVKDRAVVAERMKAHINSADATPLLVFPEGTCVNNEYSVMFKRGAFDLGATVCPVAIKYNKIFVDAFWNSRRQPFTIYIFKLMTSWALVADVYFLPPTAIKEGETSVQFAERVQRSIADVAGLRIVPWDGYLKYYNLANKRPQLVEARRRTLAKAFIPFLASMKQ